MTLALHTLNVTLESIRHQMYELQRELRDGKISEENAQTEIWRMSNRLRNLSDGITFCATCDAQLANDARGTTCDACLVSRITARETMARFAESVPCWMTAEVQ